MFGNTKKLGRPTGGGRGGGKRMNSSFLPPSNRPTAGRIPMGGGARARPGIGSSAAASAANEAPVEETFRLVSSSSSLAFAMIIRLTPDLVDEIRRQEAQGGTASIKFDANANNPLGNAINVGGKDFRFTWSNEMGDLCDIYEERQSGDDGNGLLVESGCAWRKVNVQRILDESTTNHVKMRSEEAERKSKSRKAIVLDHGNPSMKSQVKAMAAAEATPWRMGFKQKKEPPFKKRKVEAPPVGGPPKSFYRSGLSMAPMKGRFSASPLPSPPDQPATTASPIGSEIMIKSNMNVDEMITTQGIEKETIASFESENPGKLASVARGMPESKRKIGSKPLDLQSMLITLLMENAKGMTLKALEKAVGDAMPHSAKKIEPIIKKIATFQAPGRYFLKPGVDLESFRKPLSGSGSSPEDKRHQAVSPEEDDNQIPGGEPNFIEKAHTGTSSHEQVPLKFRSGEDSNAFEKTDPLRYSPDLFGDKKVSDNSDVQGGNSSDTGSDSNSENDSSDSQTDSSPSSSRSRSGVGSGSCNSSDSESDASHNSKETSHNSKETSDEDVDIMTSDDDKESKHKYNASQQGLLPSPVPWRTDGGPVHTDTDEKQDGHVSDEIDIENDLLDEHHNTQEVIHTNLTTNKKGDELPGGSKHFSSVYSYNQQHQSYVETLFNDEDDAVKDENRHEQSDSFGRTSGSIVKRDSDAKCFDEHTKRLEEGTLVQQKVFGCGDILLPEGPCISSHDTLNHFHEGPPIKTMSSGNRDRSANLGIQKGYNQSVPWKSNSDQRYVDNGPTRGFDATERSGKRAESFKYSERRFHPGENSPLQKGRSRGAQNHDGYSSEKKVPRSFRERGTEPDQSMPLDSSYGMHGQVVGEFKEAVQISNSQVRSPPKDRHKPSAVDMGGTTLRRELSALELGELREPMPQETAPCKKQIERKSVFNQLENKSSSLDNQNSEKNKEMSTEKATLPPPNAYIMSPRNLSDSSKKRNAEDQVEDARRPQQKPMQSQPQHLSRVDNAETGFNGASQVLHLESSEEAHKKAPDGELLLHDAKQGNAESRVDRFCTVADLADAHTGPRPMKGNGVAEKKRDFSPDKDSSSYSKYEKEEPELKGPIKDIFQYNQYVQEYRDKYDSYSSLNYILENYRNEFSKLGKDLEAAKCRDTQRYYNIMEQLKESYRQCGTKHKRLKKKFVVLHEELKHLKQRIKDFAFLYHT